MHIYSKFINNCGVIICLYVDDLLIVRINMKDIHDTKKYLNSQFKMKDLEVRTILDIKVKKHNGGYLICHSIIILRKYILNLII